MAARRLLDLPGIADLETQALMNREFAEPDARSQFPELDARSCDLFGLTADEAEAVDKPVDWKNIETAPPARQAMMFEDAGWDVTDDKRRPLRVLGHFNQQLWCAIHGLAGELPPAPVDDEKPDAWGAALSADAAKFRRR